MADSSSQKVKPDEMTDDECKKICSELDKMTLEQVEAEIQETTPCSPIRVPKESERDFLGW